MFLASIRLPSLLIAALWTIIIAFNLLLYPVLPAPPSMVAIGTCALGTLLLVLPSLLEKKLDVPIPSRPVKPVVLFTPFHDWIIPTPHRIALVLIAGTLAGTLVDYVLAGAPSLSMAGSPDVSQVRAAHLAEGIEFSPLRYLSLLLKSVGLLSLAFIVVKRAPWFIIASAILVSGVAGVVETATYGGRAFIRVTLSFVAAAGIIGGSRWIIKHRTRVLVSVSVAMIFLLVVNVWFNRLRVSNLNEYVATVRSGQMVSDAIGLENLPADVNFGVGLIVGYLITPVGYFDHFLKVHNLDPAYGAFTFQTVGNRLGYDFVRVKEYVDDYYLDFGINYNIWATAFRELMIDTGPWLFLPVCGLIGVGWRSLRRKSAENPGALLLYIVIFAWLLNSPFESIFKSRYVEFGFMLSVGFFVAYEVLNKWVVARNKRIDLNTLHTPGEPRSTN